MHIALYKPDIPQNTAAIIRLGACLNLKIHIIGPCGFNLHDSRFKRVVMDYMGMSRVFRYEDYDDFLKKNKNVSTFYWSRSLDSRVFIGYGYLHHELELHKIFTSLPVRYCRTKQLWTP